MGDSCLQKGNIFYQDIKNIVHLHTIEISGHFFIL